MSEIEIRPMPVASLERVSVEGAAGAIELDINDPGSSRRGVALIAHPNPVQGGTKDNKVVTTLAKAFFNLGYVAARPNFRGVGASAGDHDGGRGETDDLVIVASYLSKRYGSNSFLLAGFSFGSFVQTHVAKRVQCDRLVLVGPAVNRFPAETVPPNTLVVHGEHDDVVPLQAVFDWARPQQLPIVVVPGGEHFFHGRLNLLAQIVAQYLQVAELTNHLQVVGLRKSYDGLEVIAGLDLSLEPGVCFGLLGPNGAGKTTTLRLCLGLAEPDSGDITMLGFPVPAQAREARARIGVVPQLDNLDPDFTVRENLLVYASYFGIARADLEARIPALLEFAGLTARADSRIQALSGGMKRRLTLARALVNDPQLIFLDEPSTGLDPQARHLIWERLRKLTSEGRTILLTTHFMDEAERLCDRVAIIDHGRKIAEGAPRELIAKHIEPQVVEVFGDDAADWADRFGRSASERCERTGETVFCYAHDADALVHALDREPTLRYLHRPANLEDVFLKLTGRELRD